MNETVQPETDATAEPTAEATSEQDGGLDAILNEWDDSPEKQETVAPQAPDKSQEEIIAAVEARLRATQDYETFLDEFSDSVSDLSFEVKKPIIDGWLNDKARKDSRINNAYSQRHSNPVGWKKVFASLSDEFKSQFTPKESTEERDREAAAAFVRGSSTKEVPQPSVSESDLSKMSDQEFADYERKEYGV